jgi:hypothetical protein
VSTVTNGSIYILCTYSSTHSQRAKQNVWCTHTSTHSQGAQQQMAPSGAHIHVQAYTARGHSDKRLYTCSWCLFNRTIVTDHLFPLKEKHIFCWPHSMEMSQLRSHSIHYPGSSRTSLPCVSLLGFLRANHCWSSIRRCSPLCSSYVQVLGPI